MTRILFAAMVMVTVTPRPSEACSSPRRPIFDMYERAETVAVVKVRSVPANGAGQVELTVIEMVKGDANKNSLVAQETGTTCSTGFIAGRTGLVFLDTDGRTIDHSAGFVGDVALWRPVIERYAAASDDAGRFAVVLATLLADRGRPGIDASDYLVDRPELLARIDRDARAKLLDLARHPGGHEVVQRGTTFALLLVRLRDPDATTLLEANAHGWAGEAQPLVRITKFETETDPNRLADAISTGRGEAAPERIAALDRCERLRGKQLYPFTSYDAGASEPFWNTLAKSCRTGTPVRP
jgi:hypothetical protein